MNQPTPGHPDCTGSTSQQIPLSPLGPPSRQASLLVSEDSSLLEHPPNAADIANANMSVVSSALNLDVFITVTPDIIS
mgnify:CR=1 FL=1